MKYDQKTQKRFGLTDSEIDAANNVESSPWHDQYQEPKDEETESEEK